MKTKMIPDQSTYKTPGQLIQDLLRQAGWTQRVLAIIIGCDESTLNKIIAGKRPLDADMALALSEVFSVDAELFMRLQKDYDLAQARLVARPDPGRSNRAHLFGNLPVTEMIKRGWIQADDLRNVSQVEAALTEFFNAATPDEIEILPHAAKKTDVVGEVTPTQLAWLFRVKQIAKEILVARYSHEAVIAAIEKLRPLRATPEDTRKVPKILAECGIRFVLVESLIGAKIDGVCFWIDEKSPVVGMTIRYDRIDNFWFVLRHEIEHVLRLHGQGAAIIDAELEGDRAGNGPDISEEERVANEAAAEFCVPTKSMDSFIARKAPFFAERDLIGFARTLRIHPGLIAGQLQHRTKRYERFRAHLAKVREQIAPSSYVDGWGDIYPVGI
ncbi:MAG TPA: HigA family addiction module antitoxin [Terrimicrobiaceae bacterium]